MKLFQTSFSKGKWEHEIPKTFNSEKALFLVFFDTTQEVAPVVAALKKSYPLAQIVGCSGSGEIQNSEIFDDRILVTCSMFESPASHLKVVSFKIEEPEQSFSIGESISKALDAPDLQGIFILSEGLNINGTPLVQGVLKERKNIAVSGGLAGDHYRFGKTQTVHNGQPLQNQIVAVGFYGAAIGFHSLAMGGWSPFGIQRKVTKSESNILYEIDDKPALDLYKQFLGKDSVNLPSSGLLFPLLIENHPDFEDRNLVRTLLNINESNQSMIFAGDVPQGSTIRLMRASMDELVGAANQVALDLKKLIDSTLPTLSIAISCVGRRLVLGESTEDELEVIQKYLNKDSVQTGFYSYGELAPLLGGFCDLHNQTMTLTWITEKQK